MPSAGGPVERPPAVPKRTKERPRALVARFDVCAGRDSRPGRFGVAAVAGSKQAAVHAAQRLQQQRVHGEELEPGELEERDKRALIISIDDPGRRGPGWRQRRYVTSFAYAVPCRLTVSLRLRRSVFVERCLNMGSGTSRTSASATGTCAAGGELATFGAGCFWGTERYFQKFQEAHPGAISSMTVGTFSCSLTTRGRA